MARVLADALEQEGHLVVVEDAERATQLHHEALAERVEHGLRVFYADSLDALAMLAGRSGRTAEAARVLGVSDAARHALGYPGRVRRDGGRWSPCG